MDNNYNTNGNWYQENDPYMNNSYGNYNPEPPKAPNIFEQFVFSFIPPQYNRLTKVRTGSMIGFVTLLALIATIISFVETAVSFALSDVKERVNELPEFEIRGGRLHIEESYLYDDDEMEMFVFLTEDIDEFTYDDAAAIAAEGYRRIMLAGRESISIMQNGEYQRIKYGNFAIGEEINKDWVVDTMMPIIMIAVILGYIIFFVGRVLWYFLCAAVYLLIAMIIALIMKKQQAAGALFRIAVYSKVLMFVVATLLSVVPFVNYSVPFIFRVAITVIFMCFAIAQLPEQNQ